MQVKYHWINNIEKIDKSQWDEIFSTDNILKSYGFQKATEKASLENIRFYYLLVKNGNQIIAIMPCFSIQMDILILSGMSILKSVASGIRKLWPGFLFVKIFVIGTPTAICDHMIGLHPKIAYDKRRILTGAWSQIKQQADTENCRLIMLKEVPEHQRESFAFLDGNPFIPVETLPGAYLFVSDELKPFPTALRRKYRYRINHTLKNRNKEKYTWEVQPNFGVHSERIAELYLQVLEKSHVQFERLNKDFLKNVDQELGARSFAILCWNTEKKLVCFELILEQGDTLIPLYLGIDYDYRDEGDLYFNCIYHIIQYAEAAEKKLIKLGQTSYPAKAYVGSVFERSYLGFYSSNHFLLAALNKYKNILFPMHELPIVRCYRDENAAVVAEFVKQRGLITEPIKTTKGFINMKENNSQSQKVVNTNYNKMAN
jgi:hypothetical protein